MKEYLKKEFEKHGYSPNDTHHEGMVEDIFKNEDEDKDGFISAREFTYQHDELWKTDFKNLIQNCCFIQNVFMSFFFLMLHVNSKYHTFSLTWEKEVIFVLFYLKLHQWCVILCLHVHW